MATITLEQVTKRYPPGSLAVDDFKLAIKDREFVMLVGPEDSPCGELLIGGKVVNNESPKDRDIAMVFQSYALYPHMTVRENMGFALKLAKTPKAEIDQNVE